MKYAVPLSGTKFLTRAKSCEAYIYIEDIKDRRAGWYSIKVLQSNMKNQTTNFWMQTRSLRWPFWAANIMEMIERLAYYGVRVVIPIYIAQANEIGGLHFSQADKGFIFMWWALVQSALPVFTGGFADRYGYKKQIVIAIILKSAGYLIMATQREFWPFFSGCMVLAAGTAIFKPPIQGTFVKTLDESGSGIGWGYFYMVVNVGGFLGPPLAHYLYGYSWPAVFYGCAVLVCVNLIWLFTYRDVEIAPDASTGVLDIMKLTFRNIMNIRLIVFIAIVSIFWASFTQLFDMLPNFIVDWLDSDSLARRLPRFMLAAPVGDRLHIAQEWVINLNPLLIILFVAPLSWLVNRKIRRLTSIVIGIAIASCGMVIIGSSMSIYLCLAGIACFSIGEMLSSPKMSEYLGVIAPPDQKALYMGYSNIPFAIGWGYGSYLGGQFYGSSGEKATLALRYLAEVLHTTKIPPRTEAFDVLCRALSQSQHEVTTLLWNTYHPGQVWLPFAAAGFIAAVVLALFNYYVKKTNWRGSI
jgi:dipeptide/tripeptide permease